MLLIDDIYYTDALYVERTGEDGVTRNVKCPPIIDKVYIASKLGLKIDIGLDGVSEEGELTSVPTTIDDIPIEEYDFGRGQLMQFFYEIVVADMREKIPILIVQPPEIFKEIRKWN